MKSLAGRVVLVTGSTRGIGRDTAIAYGKLGASVIVTGQTTKPLPNKSYTIYDTANEVEKAGGRAIALEMDVRDEKSVANALDEAMKYMISKGIGSQLDILVNNAGYISLRNTETITMQKYDLMNQVNLRGSYMVSKLCLPYFKGSLNPHIVSYCPPLDLNIGWFKNISAYTVSKFGISMCVLGMAEEFKPHGIAVNGLWPRYVIATESVMSTIPGSPEQIAKRCRKPEIMADATVLLTSKPSNSFTGNLLLDEDVLRDEGITDFQQYKSDPEADKLINCLFLPGVSHPMKDSYTTLRLLSNVNQLKRGVITKVIISKLKKAVQDGTLGSVYKSFLFVVSDNNSVIKQFHINCSEKKVIEGEQNVHYDYKITTDEETLAKLFSGKLNPFDAVIEKRLSLEGKSSRGEQLLELLSKFSKRHRIL